MNVIFEVRMRKIKKMVGLFIINHFLCMTRFFKLKRLILKSIGCKIGKKTKVVGPIYFGNEVNLEIGENCWINGNFRIEGNGLVKIGDNVDIAPLVTFLTGSHYINLSHTERRAGKGINGRIEIGNNCWVCAKVTILPNIIIENGCVLAAGAVITKDCKKNTLIGGVPGVEIKKI